MAKELSHTDNPRQRAPHTHTPIFLAKSAWKLLPFQRAYCSVPLHYYVAMPITILTRAAACLHLSIPRIPACHACIYAHCCQMAKFDPFLSLDCAPTPSTLAQSKERKGSNFAIWQQWA